jgi:dipeptidyl aminopeptidase/acylaminoacyl peptidase
MGAYTALGVARADARVAATVSILGSPDWSTPAEEENEELRELMSGAPVSDPDATARAPLLLANAGLDVVVPPDAARAFAERLRHRGTVEYVEHPLSDHMMRPDEWAALWERIPPFLWRALG